MISESLVKEARYTLELLRRAELTVVTAESCTGGLIAAALTEVPGSSDVVERGFVTYSNEAKTDLLGVPDELIAKFGAVSREVAVAMAAGALANSHADVSLAVTGVAGPGGGSQEKPVGLVHVAAQRLGTEANHLECRFGAIGRNEIRQATVRGALEMARGIATELLGESQCD